MIARAVLAVALAAAAAPAAALPLVTTTYSGIVGDFSNTEDSFYAGNNAPSGKVTIALNKPSATGTAAATETSGTVSLAGHAVPESPLTAPHRANIGSYSAEVGSIDAAYLNYYFTPSTDVTADLTFHLHTDVAATYVVPLALYQQLGTDGIRNPYPGQEGTLSVATVAVAAGGNASFAEIVDHRPGQQQEFNAYTSIFVADALAYSANGSFTLGSTREATDYAYVRTLPGYQPIGSTFYDTATPFLFSSGDHHSVDLDYHVQVSLFTGHSYSLATASGCSSFLGSLAALTAGYAVECTANYTSTGLTDIRDLQGNPVPDFHLVYDSPPPPPPPPPPGVPEPENWALMLVGFGLAGTLRRYSKLRSPLSGSAK